MENIVQTKKFVIEKEILFTWITLFIQFSLTTVDFIFLEKVSYLATIGVASIIPFTYMVQHISTLLAQSMVTNASYHDSKLKQDFGNITFISFIFIILIILIIVFIIFFFKDYFLSFINISEEAKKFSSSYMTHIIPFFIVFSIQQYLSYILYTLGYALYNFIYFIMIMILNIIFNFISLNILKLGLPGIIWSSTLSISILLPIYFFLVYGNKFSINLNLISKHTYKKVLIGFKKLGIISIFEPLMIASLRFIVVGIAAYLGEELVSAKRHASNFLTICLALSLAAGIIIQIYTARLYGENKLANIKNLYHKYLYRGLIFNILCSLLVVIFIFITIDFYSDNETVKKYIIISLLMGIFIEAARYLSISSRSHLRGLQSANIPFVFSFSLKIMIICPLFFLVINYTELGIIAILFIEGLSNLLNFIVYTFLAKRKYR